MPGINHLLNDVDIDLLRDFAQSWGLDISGKSDANLKTQLRNTMSDLDAIREMIETLPTVAKDAIHRLASTLGKMSWTGFTRQYGDVRSMGPGRREREQPAKHPHSTAEILWYRGLIGRAFFDEKLEAREYAYIPDEILKQIEVNQKNSSLLPGHPSSLKEHAYEFLANQKILDHCCTLLAALRMDKALDFTVTWNVPIQFLMGIMAEAGLLDAQRRPIVEPVRKFLEASPGEALLLLAGSWFKSTKLNDMLYVPGFTVEGELVNHPVEIRKGVLEYLKQIPNGAWWNLQSFIQSIHDHHPDFQRPAGDYDSWFIHSKKTGEYLRGFEYWDEVDGAFLRYLITGPLHWLGFIDLASSSSSKEPMTFRFSTWSNSLFNSTAPQLPVEDGKIAVRSNGLITVSENASRAARYIITRFCDWGLPNQNSKIYQLSAQSLKAASEQGLRISHLLHILDENSAHPISPTLVKALERWEKVGTQAKLQATVLLKVTQPEILNILKQSKAARYLGAELNPTTIEIRKGFEKQVLQALFEIGYLADLKPEV
jgi:hypothetical protein